MEIEQEREKEITIINEKLKWKKIKIYIHQKLK